MSQTVFSNPGINNLGANTGSINASSQTRTVSVTLIPFIRSRKVYFYARGLLPSTTHTPYFNGVDVSDWCREETFVRTADNTVQQSTSANNTATAHPQGSSALISDANGEIQGSFFVPNTASLRFRTGTRQFKLLDDQATTDDNALSKAFADYRAVGTLETTQVTNTNTVTNPRPGRGRPPRLWHDPVAQSFIIPNDEGAFITSVDVCFKTKSSTVPIRMQIRSMELGLPTTEVLAQKWLNPSSVKVSTAPSFSTSSTYTTFTFDEPVYVEGKTEYCIVLISNSNDYEVWTAIAGDFLVGSTTRRLMKQPTLGSFFKSQNASTWTPEQERDLMFRMKRASFTLSAGEAYFENLDLPVKKLGSNPIETTNTSGTIRVYHANHGLMVGDSVTLAGAADTNGVTAAQINTAQTVVNADDIDSYTVTTAGTATSTGRGGGSAVTATENYKYNRSHTTVNSLRFPSTTLDFSAKTTSAQSVAGAETAWSKDASYAPIYPNTDRIHNTVRVVGSAENETASVSGERTLALKADMQTTNEYVSPIIDLQRLSTTLIGTRIDRQAASPASGFNVPATYVAETDALNGSSVAKHVFKPVTLIEPAIGLKVLFAANRPSNTYIDLYYKILGSGSDLTLNDIDWTLATIDQTIQSDDDRDIYREYEYTIEEDQFTRFVFKLVFTSSDEARYPRVRDFRAIALNT